MGFDDWHCSARGCASLVPIAVSLAAQPGRRALVVFFLRATATPSTGIGANAGAMLGSRVCSSACGTVGCRLAPAQRRIREEESTPAPSLKSGLNNSKGSRSECAAACGCGGAAVGGWARKEAPASAALAPSTPSGA
eukprot:scaffold202403_cov24-Tisochrysis_lutea.AAC.2